MNTKNYIFSLIFFLMTFSAKAQTFTARDFADLQDIIAFHAIYSDPPDMTIIVEASFSMTANIEVPANILGKTLTITSADPAHPITLTRGFLDYGVDGLFILPDNANLILKDIIIDGNKSAYSTNLSSLVKINGGNLTLNNGVVLQNNSAQNGGGVFLNGGSLTMNSGTVLKNNYATIFGGGLYLLGSFTMTGGEISSNSCGWDAGGVYNNYATFNLGGDAVIKDNTKGTGAGAPASNLFFTTTSYITLGTGSSGNGVAEPTSGMEVWVTKPDNNGIFVNSGATAADAAYFHADDAGKTIIHTGGQLQITDATTTTTVTNFVELQDAIADYASATEDMTIIVSASFYLTANLSIPANAGKTLTITSDNPALPVTLTRGFSDDNFANGLFIMLPSANAILILKDIIIDGNRTTYTSNYAPLVFIFPSSGASLILNNGAVLQNNSARSYAGGVVLWDGSLTINNGAVLRNNAGEGGGVFFGGGSFTMTGGEISGNSCGSSYNGGGVYFNAGTFNLGGNAVIKDNTKGNGAGAPADNVFLSDNNRYITLGTGANAPTSGMEVWVTKTESNGIFVSSGATASDADYFHADESGKRIVYDGGQLIIEDAPYFTGDGTSGSPYIIETAEQLAILAELTPDPHYSEAYYQLANDIDLSAYGAGYNNGQGWIPIGYNYSFQGKFDGNGKKITNLYINNDYNYFVGLFGAADNAEIKNLDIVDANIFCDRIVGGIVGYAGSSNITDCYVTGTIYSVGEDVGGIVGNANGSSVNNCYSTATINGGWSSGGIVGVNQGSTISNCAALNPSVKSSYGNVGRVAGLTEYDYVLSGNVAFYGMLLEGAISGEDTHDGRDGVSKTAAQLQSASGFPAALTTAPWTYETGKLPGFGAAVDMPAHLKDGGETTTTVTTFAQLQAAVASYASATEDMTIIVGASFNITAPLEIPANAVGKALTIKSDATTRTLKLDYSISVYLFGGLFNIPHNARLILEDIIIDGNKSVNSSDQTSLVAVNEGTLVLNFGAVLQNNHALNGGGVYLYNGEVYMNDGAIVQNNTAENGGGIYLANSPFYMNGGEIKNNNATWNGGGVFIDLGALSMSGGDISNNFAEAGGGGVFIASVGHLFMYGGEISDNSCGSYYGGGLCLDNYGTFVAGGTAVISGNKKGTGSSETVNNVFLGNNCYLFLGDRDENGSGIPEPATGMEIWVTKTENNGIFVNSDATAADADYFHADDAGKTIVYESGALRIETLPHPYPLADYFFDFNDNVFDTSFWINNAVIQNDIRVEDGVMKLEQNGTDRDAHLLTKQLDFDDFEIERDVLIHRSNSYHYSSIIFLFDNGKNIGISYRYTSYDAPNDRISIHIDERIGAIEQRIGIIDMGVQPIFDNWFHEKIIITTDGKLQYYLNNSFVGEFDVSSHIVGANSFFIRIHPWGWYTGHYQHFDNFALTFTNNTISVTPRALLFRAAGGEETLTVTSDMGWTAVSSDNTWLSVAPTSGSGAGVITVTASEYTETGDSERTATVTVTNEDESTRKISVRQLSELGYFYERVAAYASATSDTTIIVSKNLTLDRIVNVPANAGGFTLTIKSADPTNPVTLTRGFQDTNSNNGLFVLPANAKLILEDIIIDGNRTVYTGNTASLVRINGGELTVNEGAVLRNNRAYRGGGVYMNGGAFTMNDGEISDNIGTTDGGGVYMSTSGGAFTMNGGVISGNNTPAGGGGVRVNSSSLFTMNDGEISDNTANYGGGVDINGGAFIMKGGALKGNSITSHNSGGGGVCLNVDGGTFTMLGGEISGNTSTTSNGAGVSIVNGTFNLGGTAVIKNNTNSTGDNNVFLPNNRYITLTTDTDAPASGMEVWLTKTTNTGIFVESGASAADAAYFHADDDDLEVAYDKGVLALVRDVEAWDFYRSIASYATFVVDSTIILNQDLTLEWIVNVPANAGGYSLTVKSADPTNPVKLTRGFLDTNANNGLFMLTANANLILEDIIIDGDKGTYTSNNAPLVRINAGGSLTMNDGAILQNNRGANGGGGVFLAATGALFTMNGGKIRDNTAPSEGGGVYNGGTFIMTGGEITGNTCNATSSTLGGGGVNSGGFFTMLGGKISGNTAAGYGGGVRFDDPNGSFTMLGGEISDNSCGSARSGGGVYFINGTFNMGGTAVVRNNLQGSGASAPVSNVFLPNARYITLGTDENDIAAPAEGMEVWVTKTDNNGVFAESGATEEYAAYFHSDDAGLSVIHDNGLLALTSDPLLYSFYKDVASYASATADKTIVLSENLTLDKIVNVPANADGFTLTITSVDPENPVTLTRGFQDGTSANGLFMLPENAKLILENIIIDGNRTVYTGNNASLVRINGGELTVNEGAVLKNNRANDGGGVFLNNGAFTFNNGEISNNITTNRGGGVYVHLGTFRFNNGKISDNSASNEGGGVQNSGGGIFIMTGGEIYGNTSSVSSTNYGGGGVVGAGTFTMSGGKISGNTAAGYGGGVRFDDSNGLFTMTGGEISDNSCGGSRSGGGIYFINGTLNLGGDAVIKNNTRGTSVSDNLFLENNRYINLATDADAPAAGMEVWVTKTANDGVIVESGATEDDAAYFHADEPAKSVRAINAQLIIVDGLIRASQLESFGAVERLYEQPEAQTLTITNTGAGSVTLMQPTATFYIIGELSQTTLSGTGSMATFTIQPKADLQPGNYNENISIVGSDGSKDDITTVTARFTVTPIYYTVTFGVEGGNGAIKATVDGNAISSGTKIEEGKNVVFTATPDLYYKVNSWTHNDETVNNATGNSFTLYELAEAADVIVEFKPGLFHVNSLSSFGSLERPYELPLSQTITITNTSDGVLFLTQPEAIFYTIGNLSETTLTERGATATFAVQPKAGLPSGVYDENISITVTDGVEVEFATLNASFAVTPTRYTVTFGVAGENGTLRASVNNSSITSGARIEEANDVVFFATPEHDYRVKEWTVNGVRVTGAADNSYTLSGLFAPATVSVEFEHTGGYSILLALSGTASVFEGLTPVAGSWNVDYHNIDFTVYNTTQNSAIPLSVQYPWLSLQATVVLGDVLRLTATSRTGIFQPAECLVTVADFRNNASINVVQHGAIRAESANANANFVGIVYNSAGMRVAQYAYNNRILGTANLPDGQYSLVSMSRSAYFNSITSLSGYSIIGMEQGSDYLLNEVVVKSGEIVRVSVGVIPVLDEERLKYTDGNTSYTVGQTGTFKTFRAEIELKEDYLPRISNLKLVAEIPPQSELINNSVITGVNPAVGYYLSGAHLYVPLSEEGGVVRFSVSPLAGGEFLSSAYVEFEIEGIVMRQPIGAARFNVETLSINVPQIATQPSITVHGITWANSQVQVFDGKVKLGETTANVNGVWALKCNLNNPRELSEHPISARITSNSEIAYTETKIVTHDKMAIPVTKVLMYNSALPAISRELREYETEFDFNYDFANPLPISDRYYWYTEDFPDFMFTIEFENNNPTLISNVRLHVFTSSGTVQTLPAIFDSEQMLWVATGDFDIMNLPINVNVDYNSSPATLFDSEYMNLVSVELTAFLKSIQDNSVKADELLAELHAELAKSSPDYSRIAELMSEFGDIAPTAPTSETEIQYLESLSDAEFANLINNTLNEAANIISGWEDIADELFNAAASYDEYSQREITLSDGATATVTIADCSGLSESAYDNDETYLKIPTNIAGRFIYMKQTDNGYEQIDFARNTHKTVTISSTRSPMSSPMSPMSAPSPEDWQSTKSAIDAAIETLSSAVSAQDYENAILTYESALSLLYAQNQALSDQLFVVDKKIASASTSELEAQKKTIEAQRAEIAQALSKHVKYGDYLKKIPQYLSVISGVNRSYSVARSQCERIDLLEEEIPEEADESEKQSLLNNVSQIRSAQAGQYAGSAARIAGFLHNDVLSSSVAVGVLTLLIIEGQYEWDHVSRFNYITDNQIKTVSGALEAVRAKYFGQWGAELEKGPSPDAIPILDAAGFVYEAIADNRLEDVSVTVYNKTLDALNNEVVNIWNAEDYEQENPQLTDSEGIYLLELPQGLWQANYNKTGYNAANSDWKEVPPPFEANIGLVNMQPPVVTQVSGFEGGIEIEFDKYMQTADLTNVNITVTRNGAPVNGTVEYLKSGENPTNKGEIFALKARFVPVSIMAFALTDDVTLNVKSGVRSYAGVGMLANFAEENIQIQEEVKTFELSPKQITVVQGESRNITVSVDPGRIVAGKKITARSTSKSVEILTESAILDASGNATIQVKGILPAGIADIHVSLDDSDLRDAVRVSVTQPEPLIIVTPQQFNFGSVEGGKASEPLTVIVQGKNIIGVVFPPQQPVGDDASSFDISVRTWSATTGGEFSVVFTPYEARSYSITLEIASTSAPAQYITLTGTGSSTVENIPVTGVTLDQSNITMKVGEEKTLTATVAPSNATDKSVAWASADPTVATVNDGLVTAVKYGETTIIVTTNDGEHKAECRVTVNETGVVAVTGVTLDASALSMNIGEEKTLTATVAPYNATDQTVVWKSGDPSVATVADGLVKALKAGETTVTVTTNDGDYKAECKVTVASATGIEVLEAPIVAVYPNPNDGRFTIVFAKEDRYRINIANAAGAIVASETVTAPSLQMDVSDLPSGVYLLTVENSKGKRTTKIIKN